MMQLIISRIIDGLGNQMFRYAAGRRLAHKLNTEFKIDIFYYDSRKYRSYLLDQFNVQANFATHEEVDAIKKFHEDSDLGTEKMAWIFMPEVLDWPDNLYLDGAWEDEHYFADIADILREEFTLKKPLGTTAQHWREKILAADCSVSLHVRHGDFACNPLCAMTPGNAILPPSYYQECVERLKQHYSNITAFVFSNNLNWCKANLHLDVPTEFVCGENLTDVEEFHLMSLCRHNIIANSTFSWWAAWLNQNPDKKVFVPIPTDANVHYRYSRTTIENSPLESDRWTRVTFDLNSQPDVEMCPYFSLLVVVNDDAASVAETLNSVVGQDYKYYEVIIIDNASTDGSGKICRQIAKAHDNVTLIKLYDKISDGAAWNKALNIAQGKYVLFMKGDDKIFPDALTSLYLNNEFFLTDVVSSFVWLREVDSNSVNLGDRKFSKITNEFFNEHTKAIGGQFDRSMISEILSTNEFMPLGSKIFKREFLTDNAIKFNEHLDDAESAFIAESMFKADKMMFVPTLFYIAPPEQNFDRR